MIKLLIQTGAHLVESTSDIASMLCKYVCVFTDLYLVCISIIFAMN